MKKYTTSQRLKEIMSKQGIKQIDILNKIQPICKKWKVKMGSNDLSQYVTGKVEPGQKKLSVLAEALNTNEVWLMGYDVPMERDNYLSPMKFNEKIDLYMKKNGYKNLEKLAKDANIEYNSLLSLYLKGEFDKDKLSIVRKLAHFMNCSIDYLAYDDILDPNQINLNGFDIIDKQTDPNKLFHTELEIKYDGTKDSLEKFKHFKDFLDNNEYDYELTKKHSLQNKGYMPDELEILFNKNKDILTEDDRETIRFIVEKRKKDIDKQRNNE